MWEVWLKSLHSVFIFFVCINVAKSAISVWRFSPHCVVKFTIVYSTNYKTVWKSIKWELLLYNILSMLYITTRIVRTYTSVAKIPRVPVENQITTLSMVKIAIKFSPYNTHALKKYSAKLQWLAAFFLFVKKGFWELQYIVFSYRIWPKSTGKFRLFENFKFMQIFSQFLNSGKPWVIECFRA